MQLSQSGAGMASDVKGLFREAELHNAILFFDECDGIFAQRTSGGAGIGHPCHVKMSA